MFKFGFDIHSLLEWRKDLSDAKVYLKTSNLIKYDIYFIRLVLYIPA